MDNTELNAAIAAKPGPKVTPERIDEVIAYHHFVLVSESSLTICIITLQNGVTVTGESACADPANFDAEIGRQIAFRNAREKIWTLEGYLLKQRLYEEGQNNG